MKTYRHLYPQIWDFENLYLAYRKARRGKRGKSPAADFELVQEDELLALQDELRTRTYVPGPYHSFYIHEPKKRLISAAPFRDRVIHHALCRVIEPIWELTVEQIASEYDIPKTLVLHALNFYQAHQEEIDRAIAAKNELEAQQSLLWQI